MTSPPAIRRSTHYPEQRKAMASNLETLVTVFCGSGFLGRNVVRALCKRDYRVRVAVRRPERVGALVLIGPTVDPHRRSARGQVASAVRDLRREPVPMLAHCARPDGSGGNNLALINATRP